MSLEFLIAYLISAGVAVCILRPLFHFFHDKKLISRNYLGNEIPNSAGLLLLLAALPVWAAEALVIEPAGLVQLSALTLLAVGCCLAGLIDDLTSGEERKGWKNHLAGLFGGSWSSGSLKVVAGGCIILLAVTMSAPSELTGIAKVEFIVRSVLLVGLCTNTINSLDVRPGRALKVFLLSIAIVMFHDATASLEWLLVAPVLAGAAVILPYDLRGSAMIGDTGSNMLGAVIGWLLVRMTTVPQQWWLIFGLSVLQATAEYGSWSRFIERSTWLRWLDQLGRPQ